MWDSVFDLREVGKRDIIVWCQREEDANQLALMLNSVGAHWMSGANMVGYTVYNIYKSNTCYRIRADKGMTVASVLFFESNHYRYEDALYCTMGSEIEEPTKEEIDELISL